jgi:hypothetical protein
MLKVRLWTKLLRDGLPHGIPLAFEGIISVPCHVLLLQTLPLARACGTIDVQHPAQGGSVFDRA